MTEIRTKIAEALVKVTNRWVAPNFPADWKLREFAELDDREQKLNLDYADAALGVIGDAPCTRDREALANLVYEAIRFADWAAGQSISPATSQPALDPVDFINAYGEATGVWHDEKLAEHVRGLIVAPPVRSAAMTGAALTEIAAERQRQISKEGWSPDHDDQHDDASLAMAAALYAAPEPLHRIVQRGNSVAWVDPWPWQRTETYHRYGDGDPTYKVPDGDKRQTHDRRRQLVIGAALIVAEIERLDRTSALARNDRGSLDNA